MIKDILFSKFYVDILRNLKQQISLDKKNSSINILRYVCTGLEIYTLK